MPKLILCLCTCPDKKNAQSIAKILLEKKLAACVNIIPGIMSMYRWQGKIQQDDEVLLLIKTRAINYSPLEKTIIQHHPYDVPEVLSFNIETGFADYLRWVEKNSDQHGELPCDT